MPTLVFFGMAGTPELNVLPSHAALARAVWLRRPKFATTSLCHNQLPARKPTSRRRGYDASVEGHPAAGRRRYVTTGRVRASCLILVTDMACLPHNIFFQLPFFRGRLDVKMAVAIASPPSASAVRSSMSARAVCRSYSVRTKLKCMLSPCRKNPSRRLTATGAGWN